MERYYWNLEPDSRERIHEITPPGDNPPYTLLKKIGKLALTRTPDLIRLGGGAGVISLGIYPGVSLRTVVKGYCCHYRAADYAVARCLSVCPSHAGILSKRIKGKGKGKGAYSSS